MMSLRILYISNQRLPTEKAYGIQIAKTCEAFVSAGAEVELLIPNRGNPSGKDIFDFYGLQRSFKITQLKTFDLYLPGVLDKLAFVIKQIISSMTLSRIALQNKYDTIYSRDESPIFFLSFLNKNLVFEAHRFSSRRAILYRRFRAAGIKIITISDGLKKEFVKFGFEADKVLVAHDGVDLNEFGLNISREEARAKVGLSLEKKIIMYSGQLFDWKGADILLEASRSFQKGNEVLFVFVGGSDYDIEKFRKKAEGLDNVLILGQKPHKDIPAYLKAADILILPNKKDGGISEFYTSPLKLFEYMATQRPIVSSDLPSLREILNENNAILVKSDDASALADGIKTVLADDALGVRISQKAFEDVEEHSWQKRAKNILNFINTES